MCRRLLYYCSASVGGIADYAHEQAKAISLLGIEVTFLCSPEYPHQSQIYRVSRKLRSFSGVGLSRWQSRLSLSVNILSNLATLDKVLSEEKFDRVLFATYNEYLAPLWAWRYRQIAKRGVIFSAVIHDPVRHYRVGPEWWHRFSIGEGYSFLREAFIHDNILLDTIRDMPNLRTTILPHGSIELGNPSQTRMQTRELFSIPEDAYLFLSFGHIRDDKNLDLVIKAMKNVPSAWLLVVGSEAKIGHCHSDEYKELADKLEIGNRCRWIIRYVDPTEAANCFEVSDAVILAYSAKFRSASGVLSIAANFRKPVLVSSGEGCLGKSVIRYQLGSYIIPDDESALTEGIRSMVSRVDTAMWDEYDKHHSWKRNAEILVDNLFE